jgi:hypothetical protein
MRQTTAELLDRLRRVLTPGDLATLIDGLVAEHGLVWGAATVQAAGGNAPERAIQITLGNEPQGAARAGRYTAPLHAVMRHVGGVSLQTVWDAAEYKTPGQGEFYAALSDYVAGKCVRLGLSLPDGRRFDVAFDTSDAVRLDRARILPVVAQVQLLATHLNEAARAQPHPSYLVTALSSPLSAEEGDVLRAVLDGQIVWDISLSMKLSQAAVRHCAASAAATLGCSWTHQAAARALHMGWLNF